MRRLISKLPKEYLVVLAVLLLIGAWKGGAYARRATKSPFVLWDFRPGMRFSELDATAFRHAEQRFLCYEPIEHSRLCEMHAAGIPGMLRVLVDADGIVARIQFKPDNSSPIMREEGRRLAAHWNSVHEGHVDPRDDRHPTTTTTRWSSGDRWGALMRYGELGRTPFDVQIFDRHLLASVAETTPLGGTVLVMNDIADSADVLPVLDDVTYALRQIRSGQPLDASLETPVPTSDVLLPGCERLRLQLGARTNTAAESLFKSTTRALLERAVAKTYSGSHVVVGESTWLVDASGNGERVRLWPVEGDSSAGIVALAVQYPGRADRALVRLKQGRPERFCRATAEVLIIEALPNGDLRNVYRIPIGEEAAASAISHIAVVPRSAAGDPAHVRIRYTTTHGTYRWMGTMEWEGVISSDPPRLSARIPLKFARITDEPPARAGTLFITQRSGKRIVVGTLEQNDWGFATRTVTVPVRPNGALDAVSILDRLFLPNEP